MPRNEELSNYDYNKSTEENYCADHRHFYGPYADIRAQLDYSYHSNYTKERQVFQDEIVEKFSASIIKDKHGFIGTKPTAPICVFTAGAMGAGKGYTIEKLRESGRFPLVSFVCVDPDEIRREFKEFTDYVKINSLTAGKLTMKEAGYIAEILQTHALDTGKNVLVDGSLRDYEWYKVDFQHKREKYPNIKLAIIHVVAPRETIFERAWVRGVETGRVVPEELIEKSIIQCAKSVDILEDFVDFFARIQNAPDTADVELLSPQPSSWEEFKNEWNQTLDECTRRRRLSSLVPAAQERVERSLFSQLSALNLSRHLSNGDIPDDLKSSSKSRLGENPTDSLKTL